MFASMFLLNYFVLDFVYLKKMQAPQVKNTDEIFIALFHIGTQRCVCLCEYVEGSTKWTLFDSKNSNILFCFHQKYEERYKLS